MKDENLIKKIAGSFSRTTGMEFDDLFQEAYIAYSKAMNTHNPNRGKLSTHVWHCIHTHLKNYINENEKQTGFCVSMESKNVNDTDDTQQTPFWEKLNQEAIEITNIIFTAPKQFMDEPIKKVEEKITDILLSRGWRIKKIKQGLQNLSAIYR